MLLDAQHLTAKVADFGESKRLIGGSGSNAMSAGECCEDEEGLAMTLVGTAIYVAPEIINHEPCTTKVDIYSYGILLLELLVGDKS